MKYGKCESQDCPKKPRRMPADGLCKICKKPLMTIGWMKVHQGKLILMALALVALGIGFAVARVAEERKVIGKRLADFRRSIDMIQGDTDSFLKRAVQRPATSQALRQLSEIGKKFVGFGDRVENALAANDVLSAGGVVTEATTEVDQAKAIEEKARKTLENPEAHRKVGALLSTAGTISEDLETYFTSLGSKTGTWVQEFDEHREALDQIKQDLGKYKQLTAHWESAKTLKDRLEAIMTKHSLLSARVENYRPPDPAPKAPFPKDEATVKIAADAELCAHLVVPLVENYGASSCFHGEGDEWYLMPVSGPFKGEKVLVFGSTLRAGELIASLADLVFEADPQSLNAALRAGEEKGRLVCFDALTFNCGLESPLQFVEIEHLPSVQLPSGDAAGALLEKVAAAFQIATPGADNADGAVTLGLHHYSNRGPLRVLPVRTVKDASAIPPTPETISSRDYPFHYPVYSHAAPAAGPIIDGFLSFISSDTGQERIGRLGFVDLRIRTFFDPPSPQEAVAIAAALGLTDSRNIQALRLTATIQFELNASNFDQKANRDLAKLGGEIIERFPTPEWSVVVIGHTSSDGAPSRNSALSGERGARVANYLRSRSELPAKSVTSLGMSADLPRYSNEEEAGRQKNRRSDIWVVKLLK